jgi:hypothetical protein
MRKKKRGPRVRKVHFRSSEIGRTFANETLCRPGSNAAPIDRRHRLSPDVSRVTCGNCLSVLAAEARWCGEVTT